MTHKERAAQVRLWALEHARVVGWVTTADVMRHFKLRRAKAAGIMAKMRQWKLIEPMEDGGGIHGFRNALTEEGSEFLIKRPDLDHRRKKFDSSLLCAALGLVPVRCNVRGRIHHLSIT